MTRQPGKSVARFVSGIPLPDRATVVVVGGGPAGAFLAIRLLRKARESGRRLRLLILEKKKELSFYQPTVLFACREGCNYCAGGISPRLHDVLRIEGLRLPEEIIEGRAGSLTVHGDWKSIELEIPEGRSMVSVFRGSRPKDRPGRHLNFDAFLLDKAIEEGAEVVAAQAVGLEYSPAGRPVVHYRSGGAGPPDSVEADFVALACGVNQAPGMDLASSRLFQAFRGVILGFRPPQVRKALICELEVDQQLLRQMAGEVHFAQYGSKDLRIEMSSIIPKGKWITVVLLGASVDRAAPGQHGEIIQRFMELPHIRRILPRGVQLTPVCLCNPNMTVGVARQPFGHRVALIGDMAVARLYKDGILSAYLTASALADCVVQSGVDRATLARRYWPAVKQIHRDNRFGSLVFLLNRVTFSRRTLSRIVYQAVLTERKAKARTRRRLADVLWRIASGDDSYRRILGAMFHPATLWLILVGGVLVTVRNYLTERFFGLVWSGFGRYPTGVPREDVREKRAEIAEVLGFAPLPARPQFERMYSIKIKASQAEVFHQLGRFGDADRKYFTPRWVRVARVSGAANRAGSTIRYDVFLRWLSFHVVLQRVVGTRYLLYRVQDGFARGGTLAFDIAEEGNGVCLLSIYVAFDFPRGKNISGAIGWRFFRFFFPAYVHDVLWNHSLCKLKHVVEVGEDLAS